MNYLFFYWTAMVNVILVAFNLLPVPPLDGSHVVAWLLPKPLASRWDSLQRYGWVILVVLVMSRALNRPMMWILALVTKVVGLPNPWA